MLKKLVVALMGLISTFAQDMTSTSAAEPSKTCNLSAEKQKWLSANSAFEAANIALARFRVEWSAIPWTSFAPEGATSDLRTDAEALKKELYDRVISVNEEYQGLLERIIRRRLKSCDICHLLHIYNAYARRATEAKFESLNYSNLREVELRDQDVVSKLMELSKVVIRWKEDSDSYNKMPNRGTSEAIQLQRYISDQAQRIRRVSDEIKNLRKKYANNSDSPILESMEKDYSCS